MADLILSIDTTASHCAAALVSGGEVRRSVTEPMAKGQAERLMPLLEEVLSGEGVEWADLSAIAVATGPGNFTGARIGVAAARGLAFALEIPAIGVSVLEALAFGEDGAVLALVDARQGTVYGQLFKGGEAQHDPHHCTLEDVRVPDGTFKVAGHRAEEAARALGAEVKDGPSHPAPETFAFAARAYGPEGRSPAKPLYVRPPDAAPSKIAPPTVVG